MVRQLEPDLGNSRFHAQVIPHSNSLNYELIDVLVELSNIRYFEGCACTGSLRLPADLQCQFFVSCQYMVPIILYLRSARIGDLDDSGGIKSPDC